MLSRQEGETGDAPADPARCSSALRPESSTGTLHHGMVRGSERTATFRAAADRMACLARLGAQVEQGAWTVSAGALLPHHAHRLVRTGTRPLARAMRSRLTGDAGTVNRRHHRVGHVFQNRYKSIVVGGGWSVPWAVGSRSGPSAGGRTAS